MRTLLAATALAVALTPAAAQAADACPNAALRTGKQALLPDCRAYEQASPVDKRGNGMNPAYQSYASPSGDRLWTTSPGGIVDTDAGQQNRGYSLSRDGGWSATPTDAPVPLPSSFANSRGVYALSDDGTKALTASTFALAPGASEGDTNLYVRDLTQPSRYTLLGTVPGEAYLGNLVETQRIYDATPDLSTVVIRTAQPVLPDVPAPTGGGEYLYALHGGNVELVSRDAGGAPEESSVTDAVTEPQNRISDDGTHVVWRNAVNPQVFRTTLGGGVVELSRPRKATSREPAATLPYSAADGGRTFFGDLRDLTPESTPGSASIYRYDAQGDRLTDLLASTTATTPILSNVPEVRAVSPDGAVVWFTVQRELRPDGQGDGPVRLYALDVATRALHLVSITDFGTAVYDRLRFSPDGRRVAIRSYAPLTGEDLANPRCRTPLGSDGIDGVCAQVFTWDDATPDRPLVCASCVPGGQEVATAGFGARDAFVTDTRESRVITDDGRVFFNTAAPLVAADTDAVPDVYERSSAGVSLLTAGDSGAPALLTAVTDDGRSVFFHTAQRLVEQDTDDLTDVYVARTDGGIAAQRVAPAVPSPPCEGDACLPAPRGDVPRPAQGATAPLAPVQRTVPRFTVVKPSAKALRAAARTGRLTVSVRVTAAGTVSAGLRGRLAGRQRTAASATRRATRAQTVRLPLRLSERARRALKRRPVSLRLTVAYSERLTRYRTTLSVPKGGAR